MTLLFAVIPDNASGQGCRTVMVMLLPFALIPDSCTSDEGSI
jgi:hypothetical protein